MVQVPCKGEIGSPSAVAPRRGGLFGSGGESGDGATGHGAPSTDAEQALDPVHALPNVRQRVGRLGALHGDERAAERVIARREVAAGAGADQGGVGGVEAAAASMERVDRGEDHGSGLRCWSFDQSRAASERAAEALHISFGEC